MDDRYIDPLLRAFVLTLNREAWQVDLTLLVGGTWVAGTMIPPRMFMQEVADFAAAQGAEPFRDLFQDMGRTFYPTDSAVEAGAAEDPPADDAPRHLHLRNARTLSPGGLIPADGCYLRLRLWDVSGWVLGSPQLPGGDPPPSGLRGPE
jgi:hypothetical protein